jgi:hypothetical protein
MIPAPASGTQLSLLNDLPQHRAPVTTPRMATNVLLRLLGQVGPMPAGAPAPSASAVFFYALFFPAVSAAEKTHGLPVTKTTLRPFLEDPVGAINLTTPTRPDEIARAEALLEFARHRLEKEYDRKLIEAATVDLLGPRAPELLITPDGIPSPLFATDRAEAAGRLAPLLGPDAAEAAACLTEAFVLLRANHCEVQTGVERLLWRQDRASAELHLGGCADGQARAFFRDLLSAPEERQHKLLVTVSPEVCYAAFASDVARKP